MKQMPIEMAFFKKAGLEKNLGLTSGWDVVNYHKESGKVWVTTDALHRHLYLDEEEYGPMVETLNEVADLEEHMSVRLVGNSLWTT
jgi:hypothetical protein